LAHSPVGVQYSGWQFILNHVLRPKSPEKIGRSVSPFAAALFRRFNAVTS
jgi:hypothetical protein